MFDLLTKLFDLYIILVVSFSNNQTSEILFQLNTQFYYVFILTLSFISVINNFHS